MTGRGEGKHERTPRRKSRPTIATATPRNEALHLSCPVPPKRSEASPPAASTSAAPSTLHAAASSAATPPSTCLVLLPAFRLRCIVDEKCVEWEGVGEHKVANVVSADRQRVQRCRFPIARSHLHRFQVCVHLHVDTYGTHDAHQSANAPTLHKTSTRTCDRAMYDGTILQLDGDGLIVQFHQKPTGRRRQHMGLYHAQNRSDRGM